MDNKKRTYKGNFDFSDFIRETIQEETRKANAGGWRTWTGPRGSDWRQTAEQTRDESDGDMVSIMNVRTNGQITGLLRAPRGWDNRVKTGALKGCMRPMLGSGSKKFNPYRYIHVIGIETINFEMV